MGEALDLTFRQASVADYEQVMRLHQDVNSGLDYLPALYHDLLRTGGAFACLAELDGKAVGFTLLKPVLGGGALLGMAERVTPAYQRRGIMTRLNVFRDRHYPQRDSQRPTHLYFTKLGAKGCKEGDGECIIAREYLVTGLVDSLVLNQEIESSDVNDNLYNTTYEVSSTRLDDFTTRAIQDMLPDIFLSSNIWDINENNPDDIETVTKTHQTFATKDDAGRIVAVSFSTAVPVQIGTMLEVHFHGNQMEFLYAHLRRHFRYHLQNVHATKLGIRVHFQESLNTETVKLFLFEKFKISARSDSGPILVIRKHLKTNV